MPDRAADGLPAGRIVSVQVGQPQKMLTASGREWVSAIMKTPVLGPVTVGKTNLNGDVQANRKYHGGPDKAVCVYCAEHYPVWRAERGDEMPYGSFGENLTVEGLAEDVVCIGDTLVVGTSRLRITQPRQPCANLQKRWNWRELPARMEKTGWTGYYCRMVQTGELTAGDTVILLERPHPDWTLLRANHVMYARDTNAEEIAALRAVPLLSAEWKRILGRKLRKMAGIAADDNLPE